VHVYSVAQVCLLRLIVLLLQCYCILELFKSLREIRELSIDVGLKPFILSLQLLNVSLTLAHILLGFLVLMYQFRSIQVDVEEVFELVE
jgi:hypothetical protein